MSMIRDIKDSTEYILHEVVTSRIAAHQKHGENSIEAIDINSSMWLPILVEEVGEVAHELTYDSDNNLRPELIDLITVAVAMVAAIDRDMHFN